MARRPWWILLFLPLLPLFNVLAQGHTIGPFDQIRQMAPWRAEEPAQPWDVLQADGALQFYVWRDMVFESWSQFQLPFWNPYQLAGTPLMANSQSAALYPPHVILGVLHVPTPTAVIVLAWFHLVIAGLGAYRLVRALGGGEMGGLLAGSSFMLSPFLVGWTVLASVPATVAWIPWALALLTEAMHGQSRRFMGVAIAVGLMGLAGHLQFLAYGLFALLIWGVCLAFQIRNPERPPEPIRANPGQPDLVQEARYAPPVRLVDSTEASQPEPTRTNPSQSAPVRAYPSQPEPIRTNPRRVGKTILAAVLAVVGGLAIAGPQLAPVLSYSQFSHRRNTPTEEGYQAYIFSALRPFELGNLINPMTLGDPRIAEDDARISMYWPALVKRGGNWAEAALSPGAVVVATLCFLPLVFRRLRGSAGAALALGGLSLLLAFGTPINRLLYFLVPGWSSTGSPGRAIVLFVLAAAVVAGLVVTQLFEPRERPHQKKVQIATLVFALLAVATVGIGIGGAETPPELDHGLFQILVSRATANGGLMALVIAALAIQPIIYGYFRGSMLRQTVVWLFPIGVCATAVLGGIPHVIPSGKPLEHPRNTSFERIAAINEQWDLVVAARRATLPPNTAALFRIHDLAGYDSLLHRETVAMLNDINGQDSAPQANGNIMFIKPRFDPEKLGSAGVTSVWSRQGVENLGVGDTGDGVFKQPVPGPGRVSSTGGDARIIGQDLNSITIEASGPGTLTLRDRMMPGWTATIGGKPVPIQGELWREVELPAGSHTILFRYTPPGWGLGWIAFLVGLVAAISAWKIAPSRSGDAAELDEPIEAPDEQAMKPAPELQLER